MSTSITDIAYMEINRGCHVSLTEIAAIVDSYDRRTAPPQRTGTKVILRSGVELDANMAAADLFRWMAKMVNR